MPDYTVKWPLEFNTLTNGFTSINRENLNEIAIFNLKNILLTIPGERIMEAEFGVGVGAFLFEQNSYVNKDELESKIRQQVSTYTPYINILDIQILFEQNLLNLVIKFSIPSADIIDELDLSIEI
jgi:phage baseplate assembly protein W|tara:strand:+ start:1469 stop:1843 length:375 start_codon:yes stop_codon:yes gene_type:complete